MIKDVVLISNGKLTKSVEKNHADSREIHFGNRY
jgi:hypothetical protein